MKKIGKSSELMWALGVILVALGVSICKKADLGVSMIAAPAFVVHEAATNLISSLSVGVVEYIIQGILLVVLCIAVRRFSWRYLPAFAVAVIYGYVLNFFLFLLGGVTVDSAAMRWFMLIIGDVITAAGVACFFRTYLPLQVYELFVAELARRYKFSINKTKWSFDISCLIISAILAFGLFGDADTFDWSAIGSSSFHSIGLGTLVTTAINSPIITVTGKVLDKIFDYSPMFPKVETALKRS